MGQFRRAWLAGLSFAAISITPGWAEIVLSQDAPIQFGKFLVRDNSAVGSLSVPPSGGITASSEFLVLEAGQPGRFTITGLDPDQVVTIAGSAAPLFGAVNSKGDTFFRVSQFLTPPLLQADGTGQLVFDMGATLQTSGSGVQYIDDRYTAQIVLSVVLP